jgi:hypothetical protein
MSDGDVHDEIARLEAEIEERSAALERCRKVILLSKLAAAAGALLLLLMLPGLIQLDPAIMIGAIAAVLGGIVLFGSTTTTAKQLSDAIAAAEIRRTELIGMLDLRTVTDGARPRWLH